jgi:WD40 repeat protein
MSAAAIPERPYKGLARFDDSELDERFFFGRERETELVASNLVASRLTVLYGPSGVGKSSLLRAGVARRLRALVPIGGGGDEDGSLPVVVDAWRDDPVGAIAVAAGARVPDSPEELADVLAERVAELGGEMYLLLDQIEEYFVYHGRTRGGPLRDALAGILVSPTLRVHVLLGIRDDALAELDAFKGRVPGLFGNVLRLDHLDPDAARSAIVEPLAELEALGGPSVEAEPALVAAVVDQVASGKIERRLAGRGIVAGSAARGRVEAPYLQLVLDRIWEVERAQGSAVLRAETLAQLGGAGRIVQQHLERALAGLDAAEREIVARLFHQLVTPSGTKIAHAVGDLSRYAGESAERLEEVLHTLSGERVVRALPGRNGGGARYEIYHDILAEAVLEWRARHEAEQSVAAERAASRRRQRRLLGVAGAALAAFAVMGLLTAYAFAQRGEAREQAAAARAAQSLAERNARVAATERDNADKERERAEDAEASALEDRDAADAARQGEAAQRQIAEAARDDARAEAARADVERDAADAARSDALVSRDEARESAATARKALAGERVSAAKARAAESRAERSAAASRRAGRRAEARARRAEAVVLLATDPEASVGRSLAAAAIERTVEVERVLRDALMGVRVRRILPGGGGVVRVIAEAEETAAVLVGSADGEVRVFEPASGVRSALVRHGSELTTAALARDGSVAVTAGRDGQVRVWDLPSGDLRRTIPHGAPLFDVALSPDGSRLATGGGDGFVRMWDLATGTRLWQFRHAATPEDVAFSADGALLLTVARDVRVTATADGELVGVLDAPGRIKVAAFSPDGRIVATGGQDNVAFLWQIGGGPPLHELQHGEDVLDVAFSPRGDLLATGSADNAGRVWRVATGGLVSLIPRHTNHVTGVAWSPDGGSIATASLDGVAWVHSGLDYTRSGPLPGHDGKLTDVLFTADGDSVVTASDDGSARVWYARVDPELWLRGRHEAQARSVAVDPGGVLVVSAGLDRAARIWRPDGMLAQSLPHPAAVTDAVFSRDGTRVATSSVDGSARVWQPGDATVLRTIVHGAPVRSVAFDRGSGRLLTAGDDGAARVWGAGDRLERELRHGGLVTDAAFSPDGTLAASAGDDGTAKIWRLGDGTLLRTLAGHTDAVTSVEFSPDGLRLLTASEDSDVRLWRVADGSLIRALTGHSGAVGDASFSPDGRWIVTAGPSTVGVWEARTGRRIDVGTPMLFLRGHAPRVRSAGFAPDSRHIVSAGDDGTVRTYLCELCGTIDELVTLARRRLERLGRNLTPAEQRRYLGG